MLNAFNAEKQVSQLDDATNSEPTTVARKTFVEIIQFIDFMDDGQGIDVVLPDGTEAKLMIVRGKVYIEMTGKA